MALSRISPQNEEIRQDTQQECFQSEASFP
jgi:hypothetical protein